MTSRAVEMVNIFHDEAKIQNIKFRTDKLKKIQDYLDSGEVEEARTLIGQLHVMDITHLEIMLDSSRYPEPINQRAKKVLAEIEPISQ